MTERNKEFDSSVGPFLGELRGTAMRLAGTRAEADDLMQEAVLRAWKYWESFEEGSNRRAWMHRIIRNTHTSRFKRVRRESETVGLLRDEQKEATASIVPEPLHEQISDDVSSALLKLPREFRTVLICIDVEGATYQETAQALGCPVGTVMSRLYRARRMMRETLQLSDSAQDKEGTSQVA